MPYLCSWIEHAAAAGRQCPRWSPILVFWLLQLMQRPSWSGAARALGHPMILATKPLHCSSVYVSRYCPLSYKMCMLQILPDAYKMCMFQLLPGCNVACM